MRQVLVEEGCDIARELYLGIVVDRAAAGPVLMVSSEGGMDIEEVAAETPELIFNEPFDPDCGLAAIRPASWRPQLGLKGAAFARREKFMQALCRLFVQARLQPGRDQSAGRHRSAGELIALDAKITLRRQRHVPPQGLWPSCATSSEEEPAEVRASKAGLSYVKLDGNIGCLVNGAGLAMSTMDIIKLHGGEPANFLDVGGGANVEQVTEAFRILLADKNVKACWSTSSAASCAARRSPRAIVEANKAVGFNVPLVVRLEGTEVEEGRKILAESGVKHHHRRWPDRRGQEGRGSREAAKLLDWPASLNDSQFHTLIPNTSLPSRTDSMSILINKNTRVICQGITGKVGRSSTPRAARNTARKWSAA